MVSRRRWLDTDAIFRLKSFLLDDNNMLKKALEMMWESEVIRVEIKLLATMWEYYNKPSGEHWLYVRSKAKVETFVEPSGSSYPISLVCFKIKRRLKPLKDSKAN